MAAAALIIGVGLSVVGTVIQASAAKQAAEAQKKQSIRTAVNERQQSLYKAALERRNAYRQMIAANANSTSQGVSSNVQGSSAIAGALGQNTGTGGQQQVAVNAADFGASRQTDINIIGARERAAAEKRMASAAMITSIGGAFGSLASMRA